MSYVFAADIGGTNMRFAILDENLSIIKKEIVPTQETKNFHKAVDTFITKAAKEGYPVKQGGFSVAGPVLMKGKSAYVQMTNAHLVVDEATIKRKTILSTAKVMNDFEAVGLSLDKIPTKKKKVLRKGTPEKNGVRVVVGPGTGLGVSIIADGKPIRSEGGVADFPIKNSDEYALLAFTRHEEEWAEGTPVTYDDFLSGHGLERLYRFLRYTEFKARRDLQYRYTAEEISKTRTSNPCSKLAFSWFERFLGRRCKNLALNTYASGGIWIAGGIIAKNQEILGKAFLSELCDHHIPSFHSFLKKLPVTIIIDENAGLIGTAASLL